MDLGLDKRTALILGGAGGLGQAIAAALAGEGAKVAIADIDEAALGASVEAIKGKGREAIGIPWDLGRIDAIDGHVAEIERRLGPVDILVNITGGPPPTPAGGQDPALWAEYFRTMILSVIATTDRVLAGMRARKWGRIITSTSSGVLSPIPNLGLSNALRLSLVGWSKTLSREIAGDGITANIVVPGRIATKRIQFLDQAKAKREGKSLETVVGESTATIPAGRYGDPSEYADVVAFLASSRASYLTGSVVRVDGGLVPAI